MNIHNHCQHHIYQIDKKIEFFDFFDPTSSKFESRDKFKRLPLTQKAIIITVVALTALFLFVIGSIALFRFMVEGLTLLNEIRRVQQEYENTNALMWGLAPYILDHRQRNIVVTETSKKFKSLSMEEQEQKLKFLSELHAAHEDPLRNLEQLRADYGNYSMIDIALLWAHHCPKLTLENLSKFGITNQSALVEIAKLCAQGDYENTILHIQDFAIEDKRNLFKIAIICASTFGDSFTWQKRSQLVTDLLSSKKRDPKNTFEKAASFARKFKLNTLKELLYTLKNGPPASLKYFPYADLIDEWLKSSEKAFLREFIEYYILLVEKRKEKLVEILPIFGLESYILKYTP